MGLIQFKKQYKLNTSLSKAELEEGLKESFEAAGFFGLPSQPQTWGRHVATRYHFGFWKHLVPSDHISRAKVEVAQNDEETIVSYKIAYDRLLPQMTALWVITVLLLLFLEISDPGPYKVSFMTFFFPTVLGIVFFATAYLRAAMNHPDGIEFVYDWMKKVSEPSN